MKTQTQILIFNLTIWWLWIKNFISKWLNHILPHFCNIISFFFSIQTYSLFYIYIIFFEHIKKDYIQNFKNMTLYFIYAYIVIELNYFTPSISFNFLNFFIGCSFLIILKTVKFYNLKINYIHYFHPCHYFTNFFPIFYFFNLRNPM